MIKNINFGSIIVTYRCNAKCHMCNTWQFPTDPTKEIGVEVYEKLPKLKTINVTGGEPFLRDDLVDIIAVLKSKSDRLVISSNGYYTEKILDLFKKHPDIGIRISIEGLPEANDELRGIPGGFDHGIRTLVELNHMGINDIGFGITVSDRNANDLIELFHLAKMMNIEFATAATHNAFYFHKLDNKFEKPDIVIGELKKLIEELLRSHKIKDWFRAYFNYGLINYIRGNSRLLKCEMGQDSFFLDPYGRVLPCNVLNKSMGDLREQRFDDIWNSSQAETIRSCARNCGKNCWMIGSVSQQMKKNIKEPLMWIFKYKILKERLDF